MNSRSILFQALFNLLVDVVVALPGLTYLNQNSQKQENIVDKQAVD